VGRPPVRASGRRDRRGHDGDLVRARLLRPKATADAVCGYLFLAGLFLGRPGAPPGSVFFGAVSLALALGVRIQIAPAIGLAAWRSR
jgi:hypothetical protein